MKPSEQGLKFLTVLVKKFVVRIARLHWVS